MRGIETRVQEIHHRMFREVARMAYHTEWPVDKRTRSLPYKIIPGEIDNSHSDVFLERTIVGKRLRLAMGLPYRSAAEHAPLSKNIETADRPGTYYTPPLINVIKFACSGYAEKRVLVTESCQGRLVHPCEEICPKGTIKLDRYSSRSHINPGKCINCGRCADMCSYRVIIIQERPCTVACGMDAVGTDANSKAEIDPNGRVSYGICLINYSFSATADRSQIFQITRTIQSDERVYAAVAPAFVGQFSPKVTPGKLRAAVKQLDFANIFKVAIDADLCTIQEAEDLAREAPEELPFTGTPCCPAWSAMAKKLHPDHAHCISVVLTPMTLTARLIEREHSNAEMVFIGPCAVKKLEVIHKSVRNGVDFVLTSEEMTGIFTAKHVDLTTIEEDPDGVNDASTDGRSFAMDGGMAKAVVNVIQRRYPGQEVKMANSQGLREHRKMMQEAVTSKYPGYLPESMACPGSCMTGAGIMQPVKKSQAATGFHARQAKHKTSDETEHIKELDKLMN